MNDDGTVPRTFEALAELPEMNPGPVFKLGLDATIELANPAAAAIFDDEDLLGNDWRKLCPELDDAQWADVVDGTGRARCTATLRGRTFQFTVAHRRGSPNVFVYGSDISELKRAETELADMAEFPEMNPGPVCRLDTEGRIVLANRATRELIGRDDVRGENWIDLCPGVDAAFFDRVLQSDASLAIEARVGGRDFVFSHVRAPSGGEVFVYGTDVTEEKAAERTVLRSEKMATLGTLAAGVAHELNNPAAAAARAADHLRSDFAALQRAELALDALVLEADERAEIAGLLERARDEAAASQEIDAVDRSDLEEAIEVWLDDRNVSDPWDRSPELVELGIGVDELDRIGSILAEEHLEPVLDWAVHVHSVYRLLEEIRHGAGRVSEIVGALKSYSYLGQAPAQDVDINEGLRQTLVILRSKLKQGVHVVQELADDLPRVHGFGSELNQVWTNLIDNAVGAMGGRGSLVLRSRREGSDVVVEVRDDGPGIPEEVIDRVFDPFFTTKAPGEGTGLGLHTCHAIVVKKHGGSLEVESLPGSTTFITRLPIGGPTAAAGSAAQKGQSA